MSTTSLRKVVGIGRPIPFTNLPNFEQVPAELQDLPQWVCWRLEKRDGNPTKVPYTAKSGRHARSNDPATWADFDTALDAYRRGGYSGIGFMFWEGDGMTGLDLDHVIDPVTGEIDPRALEILDRFKGTYCEISPTGTGFRIFAYGRPGRSGKNEGRTKWLEAYTHPSHRYLTVTGHHWEGSATAITEQQDALDWLHEKYFAKPTKPDPKPSPGLPPDLALTDTALLDKARAAANGHQFGQLWNGDTTAHRGDHSSADLALCSMLAFWTRKNAVQMDRLFRQSGLMRPKWDSRRGDTTYGQITIGKAIAECTEVYTEGGKGNGHDHTPLSDYSDYPEVHGPSPERVGSKPRQTAGSDAKRIQFGDDYMNMSAVTEWLIKGYIALQDFVLIFGESGTFKTLLAIEMALAIALGIDWRGRRVKQGTVLYICGEGGGAGFRKRLRAWAIRNQQQVPKNFLILEVPTILPRDTDRLIEDIKDVLQAAGLPLQLVIFDTLHRTFDGDENSAADFAKYQYGLDLIRGMFQCAVMVLHHTGHSEKDRPRGTSALIGNPNAIFHTEAHPDKRTRLICTKIKDGDAPPPMNFKLARVELGTYDEDGESETSVILDLDADYQPPAKAEQLGKAQRAALHILDELIDTKAESIRADGAIPPSMLIHKTDWSAAVAKSAIKDKSNRAKTLNELIAAGFVTEESFSHFVTLSAKGLRIVGKWADHNNHSDVKDKWCPVVSGGISPLDTTGGTVVWCGTPPIGVPPDTTPIPLPLPPPLPPQGTTTTVFADKGDATIKPGVGGDGGDDDNWSSLLNSPQPPAASFREEF